jgi:hypothetical protein
MMELEKVRIFSGDGALYDKLRAPGDPVRIGSVLYRYVELELVPAPIEDILVLTDTISNE